MNCLLILFARGKTHLKDELGFERTYLHKLKLSLEVGRVVDLDFQLTGLVPVLVLCGRLMEKG